MGVPLLFSIKDIRPAWPRIAKVWGPYFHLGIRPARFGIILARGSSLLGLLKECLSTWVLEQLPWSLPHSNFFHCGCTIEVLS